MHTRRLALQVGSLQETITVTGERGAQTASSAPTTAPRAQPAGPAGGTGRNVDAARAELEARLAALSFRTADQAWLGQSDFRPGSIGGQIKAPAKVLHVNPIYPAAMQAGAIEGVVLLAARIGVDGYVVDALESREADANAPVHPDLVAAAIEAVRGWKFTPTLLNGVPVEVDMQVSVQFSLR